MGGAGTWGTWLWQVQTWRDCLSPHPLIPHLSPFFVALPAQDTLGGRFDATQAFVGDIAQFNLWDHVLTPVQVLGMANCTGPLMGNVLPWEDKLVEAFGGAKKAAFDVCKGRAKA